LEDLDLEEVDASVEESSVVFFFLDDFLVVVSL